LRWPNLRIIILSAESWGQMAWLRQTWRKKTVVLGLLTHFCLWWAWSYSLWTKSWGFDHWAALASAIAPLWLGIVYLQPPHRIWWLGIQALMAFAALAGLTVLALRTRTRWLVLLAHVSVVVYWFYSLGLYSVEI
jgi:hypothetical protein